VPVPPTCRAEQRAANPSTGPSGTTSCHTPTHCRPDGSGECRRTAVSRTRADRILMSVADGIGCRSNLYLADSRYCCITGEWAADDPAAGVIVASGIVGHKVALMHGFISALLHRTARSSVLGQLRRSAASHERPLPIKPVGKIAGSSILMKRSPSPSARFRSDRSSPLMRVPWVCRPTSDITLTLWRCVHAPF
jgi:hypothetical protein